MAGEPAVRVGQLNYKPPDKNSYRAAVFAQRQVVAPLVSVGGRNAADATPQCRAVVRKDVLLARATAHGRSDGELMQSRTVSFAETHTDRGRLVRRRCWRAAVGD